MTPDQVQKVMQDMAELKRHQETPDSPEALASIPSLTLADLDRKIKVVPLAISEMDQAQVLLPRPLHQWHRLPRPGL